MAPYHKNAGIFISPADASRPNWDWGVGSDFQATDGNFTLLINDLLTHQMPTTAQGYADPNNQVHFASGLSLDFPIDDAKSTEDLSLLQLIQAQLKKVGIKVNIHVVEKATQRVHWRTRDVRNAVTIYGEADGRIADPTDPARTFAWLPEGQYDPLGNAIEFVPFDSRIRNRADRAPAPAVPMLDQGAFLESVDTGGVSHRPGVRCARDRHAVEPIRMSAGRISRDLGPRHSIPVLDPRLVRAWAAADADSPDVGSRAARQAPNVYIRLRQAAMATRAAYLEKDRQLVRGRDHQQQRAHRR